MALFQNRYRTDSARLRNWDYRTPGWYFVTICTHHRLCVFGDVVDSEVRLGPAGQTAEEELRTLPQHYSEVWLDKFVVMPNHVHLIVVIGGSHVYSTDPPKLTDPTISARSSFTPPAAGSLSAIIRSYKAGVTRRCHELGVNFSWQSGFHDHIVRTNVSLNAIRHYIERNTANWPQDDQNPARRS